MSRQPTEQSFLKDVAEHKMTVIRDDGLHRHIRFKQPDTGNMYFDLITWPGHLCYTGDMGTYVFQRTEDMFNFFRNDREHLSNDGRKLGINPGYWSEKLIAVDGTRRNGSAEEFDEEKFKRVILERLVSWIRDNREETIKDERRYLWDSVIFDVIEADGDSGGYRKQIAAHDFRHHVNEQVGDFQFDDLFEHSFETYTYRFVWCCYALAWGIQQYDTAKGAV